MQNESSKLDTCSLLQDSTETPNTTADILNETIVNGSSLYMNSTEEKTPSCDPEDDLSPPKLIEDPSEDLSAIGYPPVSCKEVFINQDGVHFYEDGNFWMEVPGLNESDKDDEEEYDYSIVVRKKSKVKFSTDPIRVFSTFSVTDYDRRNEDVDPVAASAEYELEKRVEKMDVFPVELMKGPEGLGLSIIGKYFFWL